MSKCSSCNQTLQALPLAPALVISTKCGRIGGYETEVTVRAILGHESELELLAHANVDLIVLPKSRYDELKGEWPTPRDVVETLQRQNTELKAARSKAELRAEQQVEALQKRNAELVRKLDDVRRTAAL